MRLRLRIVSDLHLDHANHDLAPLAVDRSSILVLAGDIASNPRTYDRFLSKNASRFAYVLTIAGNHEYYGRIYHERNRELQSVHKYHPNVVFLDADTPYVQVGNFLMIGVTLWSDYAGGDDKLLRDAHMYINDYRYISWHDSNVRFDPQIAYRLYKLNAYVLEQSLKQAGANQLQSVVITHNAPCELSIASTYKNDPANYLFANNMRYLIDAYKPRLWIHGHTHSSLNYTVGDTHVVCNPKGYPQQYGRFENPEFDDTFTVTL